METTSSRLKKKGDMSVLTLFTKIFFRDSLFYHKTSFILRQSKESVKDKEA